MTMEKALILNGYKDRNKFSLWYLLYGNDGLEDYFEKYPIVWHNQCSCLTDFLRNQRR